MRFTFEGRAIEAREGETIAAALIRAGEAGGYFCGIGVCFGCLVTVNGSRAARACLTPVHSDDEIRGGGV
jgi:aerobic-type carbon monoxide dehydrogenase small subunit (CoxS/CutS family)